MTTNNIEEQLFIKGKHINTIFRNENNSYGILTISVTETNCQLEEGTHVTIVGYFHTITERTEYIFYGFWKIHNIHGEQFVSKSYERIMPTSQDALIAYFCSKEFSGIGKKTATKIVDYLGTEAIDKILNNHDVLQEIPSLPQKKIAMLVTVLKKNQGSDHALLRLRELGIEAHLALKIMEKYQDSTLKIITENPFCLVENDLNIEFSIADEIATKLDFEYTNPFRIKGAILYICNKLCTSSGHTCLIYNNIIIEIKRLLRFSLSDSNYTSLVNEHTQLLYDEGKIILQDDLIFLPSLYYAEQNIAASINERLQRPTATTKTIPFSEFLLDLGEIEADTKIIYDIKQREAIYQSLISSVSICTGGPGTGKTTIIEAIIKIFANFFGYSLEIDNYKKEPFPIILTAPTGRAAKRLTEATNIQAGTIHRLLGWEGDNGFQYDEENQLQGELFIIDEASMIDTQLMDQLLKAIPLTATIIFIGDEDQLPSVAPGQVFKDLLNAKTIPTVYLQTVFRQEKQSTIISIAHSIKNGNIPQELYEKKHDYSFFDCHNTEINYVIKQVIIGAIKKGFSEKDIQVLAPMYRGVAGIDAINKSLQEILNANFNKTKAELTIGYINYRVGDKVIQLDNRPEDGIYNGEIGTITAIVFARDSKSKKDELYVSYDGNEVKYTYDELRQIKHAFCCSIHKSQGSEFPIVIMPIVNEYSRMLQRNLIYTAITRAQNYLIICGEKSALEKGIKENQNKRNTYLTTHLKLATSKVKKQNERQFTFTIETLETYEEKLFNTDPMIGMENITPYHF